MDGTAGEVLAGGAPLIEPALDDAFQTLLGWADAVRDIGVRANADTPADAQTARTFAPRGSGCAGPSTCSSKVSGSVPCAR